MAQALASLLELGQWPPFWPGAVAALCLAINKMLGGIKQRQHLFGVGLPVGRQVQDTAFGKYPGAEFEKRVLHQTAFAVFGFVPGVGEKNPDTGEAGWLQMLFEHFHRVMAHGLEVFKVGLSRSHEQMAYARAMHLDTQKILLRVLAGAIEQGFTIAKADFQDKGLVVAKESLAVESLARQGLNAEQGPVILKGPGLAAGQTPLAQYKTADGSLLNLSLGGQPGFPGRRSLAAGSSTSQMLWDSLAILEAG